MGETKRNKGKRGKKLEKLRTKVSNTISEDGRLNPESTAVTPGKRKNTSSFFENLKNELAYDGVHLKNSVPESSASNITIPKSSHQGNPTEVEVVTFHGHSRKRKAKRDFAENVNSEVS